MRKDPPTVVTVTVAGLAAASRYSEWKGFFFSFNIYSEEFYFLADATTGDLSHARDALLTFVACSLIVNELTVSH